MGDLATGLEAGSNTGLDEGTGEVAGGASGSGDSAGAGEATTVGDSWPGLGEGLLVTLTASAKQQIIRNSLFTDSLLAYS